MKKICAKISGGVQYYSTKIAPEHPGSPEGMVRYGLHLLKASAAPDEGEIE